MNPEINNEAVQKFLRDRSAWEHAIQTYVGTDPLDFWYNYISWYGQNSSYDSEKKLPEAISRCLSLFKGVDSYKQDTRYVKLWQKYIEFQQNPTYLYQVLYNRKIGTECSTFYIGWAHLFDVSNAFKQVEYVFNLGLRAKAMPFEELQAAYTKFRQTLAQRISYEELKTNKRTAFNLAENSESLTNLSHPQEKRQRLDNEANLDNQYNNNIQNSTYNNYQGTSSTQDDQNDSAAYAISSSLKSVYDDTNSNGGYTFNPSDEQISLEFDGVKVPPNFIRFAKNNNQIWDIPLFIEEPSDPLVRCCYAKQLVYPGDGMEYSLEEIDARKWENKRNAIKEKYRLEKEQELKEKQIQLSYQQQQQVVQQAQQYQSIYQASQSQQLKQQQLQQQQEQRQQQEQEQYQPQSDLQYQSLGQERAQELPSQYYQIQYEQHTQDISTQNLVTATGDSDYQETNGIQTKPKKTETKEFDDIEEQIEASTIRFCPNNGLNKSQTITIKFKKEKPSLSSSTPKVPSKIKRKSKTNKLYEDSGFQPSSNSNSTDSSTRNLNGHKTNKQRQISRNNMDDANLLLSIANVSSSNDDSSQSYSYTSMQQVPEQYRQPPKEQFIPNEDSFSNSEFNSSFNNIYYGNENSNGYGTPIKNNRFDNSVSKTSTPNNSYKFLRQKSSKISNQNDDSMCSYNGDQNSYFAVENDYDLKQKRLDRALATIETHLAKTILDPFSSELCKALLTKINFPSPGNPDVCKITNTTLPKMGNTKVAVLGDYTYHIEKEVGRGAYGAVYRAVNSSTGVVVALKYQKPPNSWELYICSEVQKRIKLHDILPGFMDITTAVLARNASILVSEFSPYGSLLDINNRVRQSTTKVMHESLVMHFGSQIINIIDHLHSCKIIHADIKPDNFLLMKIPIADSHVPTLRLIDFGCAIDMTLFDEGTQFKKVIQTDSFTCTEMQEGRQWTYQTDLFCLAGTVHVLLFGDYMQLNKKFGQWDIKQKLPRYLKKHVWTEFFPKLLNIKDQDHLPCLKTMKSLFDNELYSMESELQKQIRTLSNILHKR